MAIKTTLFFIVSLIIISSIVDAYPAINPRVQAINENICGNSIVSFNEQCDDGNQISGDGCTKTCNLEGIVWSTFLGEDKFEFPHGIAIHPSGDLIIVGDTQSINFPTTLGAYDTTYNGGNYDIYITRISPDGKNIIWSTFLGGSNDDHVTSMVLDASGNIIIAGLTLSTDIPTTTTYGTMTDAQGCGGGEAFIASINPNGNNLNWLNLFIGENSDVIHDIDIDNFGNIAFIGNTKSHSFPTTPNAFSNTIQGPAVCPGVTGCNAPCSEVFLGKINQDASNLLFSSFYGGESDDLSNAMDLTQTNEIVITGQTTSFNLPTTPGAYDTIYDGVPLYLRDDVFVAKFSPFGSNLIYGTYLGKGKNPSSIFEGQDVGQDVKVHPDGSIVVIGWTNSKRFPTTPGAYDITFNNPCDSISCYGDAFITKFTPDGSSLDYSTFLGGTTDEAALDLELDEQGRPIIGGFTDSTDFPLTQGAFDTDMSLHSDGFVIKLNEDGSKLLYSSYIGGPGLGGLPSDIVKELTILNSNTIIVIGATSDHSFPVTEDVIDTNLDGLYIDSFVMEFNLLPNEN